MAPRAHRVNRCLDGTDPERPPPVLASELLEEIFLRVASPAGLARASAACASFRRIISDLAFLRRYRSIHPPLLLGFFNFDGFQPVEATHPSAAIALAVARAADFSFGFLPRPNLGHCWAMLGARDGRVLVGCRHVQFTDFGFSFSFELVVCDPLSRRYLPLPLLANDLLAPTGLCNSRSVSSGACLIPSGGMEEETSASVICWVNSTTRLVLFVFSTSSGHWAAAASVSPADLGLHRDVIMARPGQCVYGCFYWKLDGIEKLLKFDMNTMGLSTCELPPDLNRRDFIIVESGEGKVAMFINNYGMSMECYTLENGTESEKSHKWLLKRTIPFPLLPVGFSIVDQAEGFIFLAVIRRKQPAVGSVRLFYQPQLAQPFNTTTSRNQSSPANRPRTSNPDEHIDFFSLEVKSFNIERLCRKSYTLHARLSLAKPYFGFPPSMSPRRIEGYGED